MLARRPGCLVLHTFVAPAINAQFQGPFLLNPYESVRTSYYRLRRSLRIVTEVHTRRVVHGNGKQVIGFHLYKVLAFLHLHVRCGAGIPLLLLPLQSPSVMVQRTAQLRLQEEALQERNGSSCTE